MSNTVTKAGGVCPLPAMILISMLFAGCASDEGGLIDRDGSEKADKTLTQVFLDDSDRSSGDAHFYCEEGFFTSNGCAVSIDFTFAFPHPAGYQEGDVPPIVTLAQGQEGGLEVASYSIDTRDEDGEWFNVDQGTMRLSELDVKQSESSKRIDLEEMDFEHGWSRIRLSKTPIDDAPKMYVVVFAGW